MSYLDLLRKYKGEITMATAKELQDAWKQAEENGGKMMPALHAARIAYKREVIKSIEQQ